MKPSQRFLYLARFSLMLLVIFASSVSAQEDPRLWDTEGVALRQGTHLEWERETAMHEDGSVCVVWSDARDGNRDIYAQMIDGEGNEAWEVGGVIVAARTGCQQSPVVAAVEGGWVIVWAEYVEVEDSYQFNCSIYAQKLNMNGESLWREDGVSIGSIGTCMIELNSLRVVRDLDGGALIAWLISDTWNCPGEIHAQRVNSIGNTLWESAVLLTDSAVDFDAASDGRGNMLLAWTDSRVDYRYDIYAAKLLADGSLPWGAGIDGIPICMASERQRRVRVCSDHSAAGMYCVWEDERTNNYRDLYMQRVDSGGLMLWEGNGLPLCDAQYLQRNARITPSMNGEMQDGFLAVWADFRVNSLINEIYGQKILENGNAAWGESGAHVCGNAAQPDTGFPRDYPWLSTDYAGGAVFTWSDTRNSEGEMWGCDLYASRVDEAGNQLWGDCGVLVQSGNNEQTRGVVSVLPGESNVFLAFEDWESGSTDLDTRLLNLENGSPMTVMSTRLIEGLDGFARNAKTVSMNNGRVAVVWEDSRARGDALYYQIIDAVGESLFDFGGKRLVPDNEDWPYYGQNSHEVCPDGFGGFYVAFRDIRTGSWSVRLSHVNANGDMDSDSAGVVVWGTQYDQQNAFVAADGQGGCYVAWSGFDNNFILEAYMMHMDANCQWTWAEPVRLANTPMMDDFVSGLVTGTDASSIITWITDDFSNNQSFIDAARLTIDGTVDWSMTVCDANRVQYDVTLAADGQSGAYFAWTDLRNTETGEDIYAQHISAEGSELWNPDGIPVYTGSEIQDRPQLVFSPDNGLYVVWEDYRSGDNLDLYAQRIDAAGNLLWPEAGLEICTAEGDQRGQRLLLNNLGGFTCVWTDRREYYEDIYGTEILPDGSTIRPWWVEGSGGRISTAPQNQNSPSIADFGDHSALVVWVDWRAFKIGNDEGGIGALPVQDLYMQRILTGSGLEGANEAPQVPLVYSLHQNYPNPFNPSTTISFSIAKAGLVSLAVYDLLGRSVTTLLDKHLNSGNYQVLWDAGSLPSGMYFYRLNAGSFSDVKKTVLLK